MTTNNIRTVKMPGPPLAPRGWRWVQMHEYVRPGDLFRDLEGRWVQIPGHPPRPLTRPITHFLYIRFKPRNPRRK